MKSSNVFSTIFVPPNPVKQFYYRCDKKFHLDNLIKLYDHHDNYALF